MHAFLLGATGNAGLELATLLHKHPKINKLSLFSVSHSGTCISDHLQTSPQWYQTILNLEDLMDHIQQADLVFTALPHGISMEWIPQLHAQDVLVIDLSGDFRMQSSSTYEQWYGQTHTAVDLLDQFSYGLPELFLDDIQRSKHIACPGCYPTASLLALAPLAHAGVLNDETIIIDAKSGISGGGKKPTPTNTYQNIYENFQSYGIGSHRHTPEIEEKLSDLGKQAFKVQFTPGLLPIYRGLQVTIYLHGLPRFEKGSLQSLYTDFYQSKPFVQMMDKPPSLRQVQGSNECHIFVYQDQRTGLLMVISAIDNLLKGAAGQAVQNMNVYFGFKETCGLT